MRNMWIQRTATRLIAWGTWVLLASTALAQVPINSNLNYSDPTPSWENGSAPFAESDPGSPGALNPFHTLGFEPKWDWFAPAETSSYGNGPRPKIGFFGSYERLFWSLAKPQTSVVGSEQAAGPGLSFPNDQVLLSGIPTIFTNTVDTGWMQANGAWGNRFEFGYWDTDNHGWLGSVLDHVQQGQYRVDHSAIIQFGDPGNQLQGNDGLYLIDFGGQFGVLFTPVQAGKIPIRFDYLTQKNIATLNGLELMHMYRPARLHNGGVFELLYGARWLQLNDTYQVQGFNSFNNLRVQPIATTITPTDGAVNYFNPLSDSFWSTRAINNMVGPQIGFRLSKQRSRWTTSLEARFLAAANFQNVHQKTLMGSNVIPNTVGFGAIGGTSTTDTNLLYSPIIFQGIGANTNRFATTFSPVGEIRLNTVFQVTSNVGLKVGYTGLVIGNVTRASNRIDYNSPNLIGITTGGNHQVFFANGINFGVEINR